MSGFKASLYKIYTLLPFRVRFQPIVYLSIQEAVLIRGRHICLWLPDAPRHARVPSYAHQSFNSSRKAFESRPSNGQRRGSKPRTTPFSWARHTILLFFWSNADDGHSWVTANSLCLIISSVWLTALIGWLIADPRHSSETAGGGCCGGALIILSWIAVCLTLPWSLCLCLKVPMHLRIIYVPTYTCTRWFSKK